MIVGKRGVKKERGIFPRRWIWNHAILMVPWMVKFC